MTRAARPAPAAPDAPPPWLEDLARELPALVPLERAAEAVSRSTRTLRRAAERGQLVMLRGDGGRAIVPRAELVRWVASWPRVGSARK